MASIQHDPADIHARLQALHRAAELHLNQVDQALDRLAQGGYGRCRTCGVEIPPARLSILPTADSCVGCATADGGRGSG